MQQQFNQNQQGKPMMQPQNFAVNAQKHGAHELFDGHEALSGLIGTLDQFLLYEQHIKDPELRDIFNRQKQFITDQYNITVECYKSGNDPSHPTTSYTMNQSNDVVFGLTPSQPKKPHQQISEITDECISGFMMGCAKTNASTLTTVASEATNPVFRRVLADSVPNYIEMAYELFLYQNKKGFYQIPQLPPQETQQLLNSYTTTTGMTH